MFFNFDGKFAIFSEFLKRFSGMISKSVCKRHNNKNSEGYPPRNFYRGPPRI